MMRDEAVMLLRTWANATDPATRTRFEEIVISAMTVNRTAASFAHREECGGFVSELRAPTLDGLREAVAAFHKPPVLMVPPMADEHRAQLEEVLRKASRGPVVVLPNQGLKVEATRLDDPERYVAPAVVEGAPRG